MKIATNLHVYVCHGMYHVGVCNSLCVGTENNVIFRKVICLLKIKQLSPHPPQYALCCVFRAPQNLDHDFSYAFKNLFLLVYMPICGMVKPEFAIAVYICACASRHKVNIVRMRRTCGSGL